MGKARPSHPDPTLPPQLALSPGKASRKHVLVVLRAHGRSRRTAGRTWKQGGFGGNVSGGRLRESWRLEHRAESILVSANPAVWIHRDLFVTPNNTPALSQSLGDAWRVNALISPLGSRRSKQATLCLLVSALRLKTKACLTVCLVPSVCGVCW